MGLSFISLNRLRKETGFVPDHYKRCMRFFCSCRYHLREISWQYENRELIRAYFGAFFLTRVVKDYGEISAHQLALYPLPGVQLGRA